MQNQLLSHFFKCVYVVALSVDKTLLETEAYNLSNVVNFRCTYIF